LADSEAERNFYRQNPDKLIAHVKEVEDGFNARFNHNILGTPEQKAFAANTEKRMREMIKDETILKGKSLPSLPEGSEQIPMKLKL
jgi:hypothetical protein